MSADKTPMVTVSIPLSEVTARYLGLGKGFMFSYPARHLNTGPQDFFTVDVSDRYVNSELHLAFLIKNGHEKMREVTLSLNQIFDQSQKLDKVLEKYDYFADTIRDTRTELRDMRTALAQMIGMVEGIAEHPDLRDMLLSREEYKSAVTMLGLKPK